MKRLALAFAAVLLMAAAYAAGSSAGIRHAIEDSEIYAVDCYDPENPEASAAGDYDLEIYIELDGETYVHGMRQC